MSSNGSEFAIVDRPEYRNLFREIKVLDFSMEEVRDHRPFLHAIGLRGKFMSELVQETKMVDGGLDGAKLTKSFRSKAHALLRHGPCPIRATTSTVD